MIRVVIAVWAIAWVVFTASIVIMVRAIRIPPHDVTAEWNAYQRAIMTPEGAAPASAPAHTAAQP